MPKLERYDISRNGVNYCAQYLYNAHDDCFDIVRFFGTLDSGHVEAEFYPPLPSDEAKQNALKLMGLDNGDWRFV